MQVQELIKQLEAYSPDTELIVVYWDKDIVDDQMTDDQWSEVVEKYEGGEFGWQSHAAESFDALAEEVKNATD